MAFFTSAINKTMTVRSQGLLTQLRNLLRLIRQRRAKQIAGLGWNIIECRQLAIDVQFDGVLIRNTSKHEIINTPQMICWQDIDRIVVFKRDRMTWNDICMSFENDGRCLLEVNEEMNGWPSLVEALPQYLDGVMKAETWFAWVVEPAFEPSTTVIYDTKARAERIY